MNQPPLPTKKSRRIIYGVLGVIAVSAVALAWGFVFLPQNGQTAILLDYHYTVGEDMTYNMTSITYIAKNENITMTGAFNLLVTGFDGENYTISENTTLLLPTRFSQSAIVKVDTAGRITQVNGSDVFFEAVNLFSSLGTFQKREVNVGETWQVPLGNTSTNTTFEGNLTCTVGPIQSIQVLAGTYKVFSIEVSSNNITETIHLPAPVNEIIFATRTLNGTSYLEYGTCRLIMSHIEGSSSTLMSNQTTSETSSTDVQLVNDAKH